MGNQGPLSHADFCSLSFSPYVLLFASNKPATTDRAVTKKCSRLTLALSIYILYVSQPDL